MNPSSSPEITSSAVATTIQKYGHLDSLILNAGTLHPLGRIASTSLAPLPEWRNAFELNFFSLVHTLQAAIPHLRSKESDGDIGGRVIFVSSGAATGGVAAWGAYSATKAAMNSLSRCVYFMSVALGLVFIFPNCDRTLANEEPSIVSVALRPGMVDTDVRPTPPHNSIFTSLTHPIKKRCKASSAHKEAQRWTHATTKSSKTSTQTRTLSHLNKLGTLSLRWLSPPRRSCQVALLLGTGMNAKSIVENEILASSIL